MKNINQNLLSHSFNPFTSRKRIIVCITLLLPISVMISLSFGSVSIPFNEVIKSLLPSDTQSTISSIIQQIRLPRTLVTMFVGAILGICGAATQGLFRNPLADPSLIGVTAGAAAGAACIIFFAQDMTYLQGMYGISIISVGAFIGGILSVILVYLLATNRHGTSVATMLLVGIAITALAGGLTSLIEFFADNEMLRRISLWRMGGLEGANFQRVVIAGMILCLVLLLLPMQSNALNALLLGESEARHLGIAVQKTKILLIVVVAAGTATSVALAGSIAFVGLIIPHIIRLLIGPDHRYLLPASAIGGAILLLLADTIARTIFSPIELPVGLVTALVGAPFFISLLRRRHEFGMQ